MERSKDLLEMEVAIAYVLRGGVIVSGVVIAIGLLMRLFETGNSQELVTRLLSGGTLNVQPPALLSVKPDSIIAIGLILLIALPIVRVAMTVFLFLKEKDYGYLAITLFVLAVLLVGVIFGHSI